MINLIPFTGIFENLIKLASEAIPDKDKQVEFNFRVIEMQQQFMTLVLQTQTVPWVDALVKILAALNMFTRPIGSALMTAFGAWAHYKQVPMDLGIHAVFDGAFPAWGVSRHMDKNQQETTKRIESRQVVETAKVRYSPHWGKE